MPRGSKIDDEFRELSADVTDYVRRLVRMIGYRRKVRREVQRELLGHFADALCDCLSPEEAQAKAEQLMAEFGDLQLLAMLCRRAKKRCRPLWLKAIGGGRMAIFLVVATLSSYTAWFVSGKPVITYEYIIKLNKISRPKVPVIDNAWLLYEKAMSLAVDPNDELKEMPAFKNTRAFDFRGLGTLREGERKAIIEWVALNEAAWAEFERGSRKPHHYRIYGARGNISDPSQFLLDLTGGRGLMGLRMLSRGGIWRARLAAEEGHIAEALDDCLVVARVGGHWQGSAVLIEQLVGVAISGFAHHEIVRIVQCHDLSEATLRELQAQLTEIYPAGYPLIKFDGERLVVLDAVQRSFTKGGPGGGHLIPGQFMGFASHVLELPEGRRTRVFQRVLLWPMDVTISMIHARRRGTIAKVHQVYDEMRRRSRLSPSQRRMRHIGGWREISESMNYYRYGLVCMLLPNESRCSELRFRAWAHHEAVLAILAIKRYRDKTGDYPAALEELVDWRYHDNGDMVFWSVEEGGR